MSAVGSSRRRRRRERGNTTLEAALSLTVFLMSIFGIMDLGRMVFSYNLVAHGAREGVRYAIVHGNNSASPANVITIGDYLRGQTPGLDRNGTTVAVTWTPNNSPGSTVSVTVSYSFRPVAPYIPAGTWILRARSQGIVAR